MHKRNVFACVVLIAVQGMCADTEDRAAPADSLAVRTSEEEREIPLAPAAYRRPADWKPVLYPRDLRTLAREESAAHAARARRLMERVDKVNREGRWHADGKSIDAHTCPEWFVDAKLGIFIDWGLWSLASWCPYFPGERLYPDWYELRCGIDYPKGSAFHGMKEYHEKNWGKDFQRDHFIDLFRASRFDAPALMKVFRECGAKYVVPFLKHHSGFCLWDCSFTFRDSVDQGPHRDLAREMADACRAEGLKFGFYDSQAGEWEYPILQSDGSVKMLVENRRDALQPLTPDMEGKASGKVAVRDFVRDYIVPQAVEFIDRYDPDIFWGDYDWTCEAASNGSYDIAAYMYNRAEGRKEVAFNDRFGNGSLGDIEGRFTPEHPQKWLRTIRGDFFTDEWGDTSENIDPAKWHPWESCSGISRAYGNHWMETEDMVMTEREFICHFADIVARGGNLLLLVNLDPQGALVEHQRKRLLQIGKWLGTYGEAIYATRIIAPYATPDIDYTRSKDGRTVYAIVKRSAPEIALECELDDGVTVTVVGRRESLPVRRAGRRTLVTVPPDLAASSIPYALRCVCPKGNADKVDTRIGSRIGRGSCLIGPCVPHGSVYPSPDTVWPTKNRRFPAPSGFWTGDKVVGFSQLHTQGTGGTPSYGLFRLVFGEPSAFEIAEAKPYRLRGRLTDIGVSVSVSATAHGAIYEFDGADPSIDVRCKIGREVATSNAVLRVDGDVLSGGGTYFGNWNPAPYDCWFYAVRGKGRLAIAVSFESVERARQYYQDELEGRTLSEIATDARIQWNDRLSRVEANGLDPDRETAFYTHLFHAFVQPRDRVSDGIGWDDHYTLWDTWKTLFPLQTIVDDGMVADCVNDFARRFERNGMCASCYTQGKEYQVGQGGDEADCVIADALARGVRGIDRRRMVPLLESRWHGRTKRYRSCGYVAENDREGYCSRLKSGSATMSFAFQDYCVGRSLAILRGEKDELAADFLARARNWTNVWNAAAVDALGGMRGFACGRTVDGSFFPSDPRQGYNRSFYEATGWEYSFFALHDMGHLIALCGGREDFVKRLEYALTEKLIDFGNEPSFLTPWLFTFAGRPDLSSKWAHEVLNLFPSDGCPGDDDSGAMGAFYVFLTAGLMPMAGSDVYLLHAPAAERIVFRVSSTGREFVVSAPDARRGRFDYRAVRLNGRAVTGGMLRQGDICSGGELKYEF